MNNSIFVLGGDMRLSYSCKAFEERGYNVYSAGGFGCGDISFERIKQGILNADIILMGIPVTNDGITLNAPFCGEKILLSDIAALAGDKKIIFGGKIPEGFFDGRVYDIAKRDDFAMYNAVPTAEGALEIAMCETRHTVWGSKCLMVGYGKIGKMLCKMFSGVGAEVTATARKAFDIAMIESMGFESARTSDIVNIISRYDIIINTVPEKVIGDDALLNMRKDALIIDTASKPGGFDIEKAKGMGLNAISALSLPGKVAPKTSGEIICTTVCNILNEPGV